MKLLFVTAVIMGAGLLAADAKAQDAAPSEKISQVDFQTAAAGHRVSRIVGSKVHNSAGETIGTIDDLLVMREGRKPYAVLSVGGFLGLEDRLVAVRYDKLDIAADKKVVLPGGSREGLKILPAFTYTGM